MIETYKQKNNTLLTDAHRSKPAISIPCSASMLFKEYGQQCLRCRMLQIEQLRGVTWSAAPAIARRAVWPATLLREAQQHLSQDTRFHES